MKSVLSFIAPGGALYCGFWVIEIMREQRQKRIYGVTTGQILAVLIIAAIALTVVFELGVWVGKRRVVKEQLAAEQQNQINPTMKISTAARPPGQASSDRVAIQQKKAEEPPETNPLEQEAAPDEEEPAPDPSSVSSEHGELNYTIQVGVFSSLENARNLLDQLSFYEYESWIKPYSGTSGQTLYYVFVERFGTTEEADQVGKILRDAISDIKGYRIKAIQENDLQ